jgi:hypothetical protein
MGQALPVAWLAGVANHGASVQAQNKCVSKDRREDQRARQAGQARLSWLPGLSRRGGREWLISCRAGPTGRPGPRFWSSCGRVTEPGEEFAPAPERVAVFDSDGTLWCEKPMCPLADSLLRRWQETAQAHPGLARKQPWQAVIGGTRSGWRGCRRVSPS